MNLPIEEFIAELRHSDPYVQIIFTRGSCFRFAELLTKMFGGKVVINESKDHATAIINGKVYDIDGINIKDKWLSASEFQIDEMRRWSFASHQMLQLCECPVCEEPIII